MASLVYSSPNKSASSRRGLNFVHESESGQAIRTTNQIPSFILVKELEKLPGLTKGATFRHCNDSYNRDWFPDEQKGQIKRTVRNPPPKKKEKKSPIFKIINRIDPREVPETLHKTQISKPRAEKSTGNQEKCFKIFSFSAPSRSSPHGPNQTTRSVGGNRKGTVTYQRKGDPWRRDLRSSSPFTSPPQSPPFRHSCSPATTHTHQNPKGNRSVRPPSLKKRKKKNGRKSHQFSHALHRLAHGNIKSEANNGYREGNPRLTRRLLLPGLQPQQHSQGAKMKERLPGFCCCCRLRALWH